MTTLRIWVNASITGNELPSLYREAYVMSDAIPACDCPKCQPLVNLLLERIRELETELAQSGSSMTNHRRLLLSQLERLNKLAS